MYDQQNDFIPVDQFGPLTHHKECIRLPEHVVVQWISKQDDIFKLSHLLHEPYIGIDCEWRPSFSKFDQTPPSIFQISGAKISFIIDLLSLKDSPDLDSMLSSIFTNPASTIAAFSFEGDILKFQTELPNMGFYKHFKNFIDLQQYAAEIYPELAKSGIGKVSLTLLGKTMCKNAQMSNWERRPLSKAQMHYAALDAQILVQIVRILEQKGQESGKLIQAFIKEVAEQPPQQQLAQSSSLCATDSAGSTASVSPAVPEEQKILGFIPSPGLTPEMKSQGFIVDKYLITIGKLLIEKGHDCLIIESEDHSIMIAQALKDNRVVLTNSLKMQKKLEPHPCGFLNFKAPRFSQFKELCEYFGIDNTSDPK
ncbi:hypothetical protein FGO68_gene7441 [Halteria grandinella]|uniref:3'-5' exonuclease domain-containing protein n=1 Tax=Halteria grandinella TaxID=5974 RepID=A0A8J8T544_HALGN|nr:hypothetical protein FGO68_gene7441 [Halteria grandinella]